MGGEAIVSILGFVLISTGTVLLSYVAFTIIKILIFVKANAGKDIEFAFSPAAFLIGVIFILAGIGVMVFA